MRIARLQYDSLGNLYEIEVAGELIRSAEKTVKYRKIDNKKNQQLMVFPSSSARR